VKALYYVRRVFQISPSYTLGRFYLVRSLYSLWMRLRDRLRGRRLPPLDGLPPSGMIRTAPRSAVAELRQTALSQCITLPAPLAEEIREFARRDECSVDGVKYRFRYADVKNGKLPDDTFVALAHCQNPTACPAVCQVRDDPVLRAIVANFLGYVPQSPDVRLYWSFVGEAADDDRRRMYQTIDFHYDVHDYNFCYVHIYLTDTDVKSGAHVMVLGSHKSKPVRWLIGSARRTDEAVENHYGREKIVCLEGAAGTGFIEDTACFHKALAPVSRERLLLQIRFH